MGTNLATEKLEDDLIDLNVNILQALGIKSEFVSAVCVFVFPGVVSTG